MAQHRTAIRLLTVVASVAVFAGIGLSPLDARTGKLDEMGDEARGGGGGDEGGGGDGGDGGGDDGYGEGGDGTAGLRDRGDGETCFLWDIVCYEDPATRYPIDGDEGEMNESEEEHGPTKSSATVRAGYQYVFDGVHVGALGIVARFDRFEFNFDGRLFTEPMPGERPDHLFLGELGVGYRIVRQRHFLVRTGVGVRILGDHRGVLAGFTYMLGISVAPAKHFLISVDGDVGNLGVALFTGGQGRIAARFSSFEMFAGWDAHVIGTVLFHGPIAGLGLRF